MNQVSGLVVSPEMMKELAREKMDTDFYPIPAELESEAKRLLKGKPVADMDKRFRYLAKKAAVAAGNKKHEDGIREAAQRLREQGLLPR